MMGLQAQLRKAATARDQRCEQLADPLRLHLSRTVLLTRVRAGSPASGYRSPEMAKSYGSHNQSQGGKYSAVGNRRQSGADSGYGSHFGMFCREDMSHFPTPTERKSIKFKVPMGAIDREM